MVDSYIHRAPSASMGHVESKTMFKCNKTARWLQKKSNQSKKKQILESISLGRKNTKADRARAIRRRQRLKERMDQMKRDLTKREEKARVAKEHLIEDVLQSGGVWTTEDEMKKRKNDWVAPEPRFERGYGYIYSKHIEQADKGCDFDFLRSDFGSAVKEPDIY